MSEKFHYALAMIIGALLVVVLSQQRKLNAARAENDRLNDSLRTAIATRYSDEAVTARLRHELMAARAHAAIAVKERSGIELTPQPRATPTAAALRK